MGQRENVKGWNLGEYTGGKSLEMAISYVKWKEGMISRY